MKIIHVCLACFYVENMEYQENVLPRKHKILGHDVYIISSRYTFDKNKKKSLRDAGRYLNKDGIPVIIIDYSKPRLFSSYFHIYDGLYHEINRINPDIIFIHGCQFYSIKDIIKYKKKNPHVCLLADNHADYINTPIVGLKFFLLNRVFWGHIVKKTRPYIEKYWGVTPLRVDYLLNVYKTPKSKTGLLVMGGDEELIHFSNQKTLRKTLCDSLEIPADSFIIVTGGKIDKKKNIHLLLRSFERLHNEKQYLVVFGSIPNELNNLFETKNDNVRFLGWQDSKKIYDLFLASDLGVFPGTHSVLWEQAVACGLPCFFKHWKGMEHVNYNGNAILIDDVSINNLEKILNDVFLNINIYKEMKSNAKIAAIEFCYINIAKKSLEV